MTTTKQEPSAQNNPAIVSMQELEDRVIVLTGRLEFGGARRTLESAKERQLAANNPDRQWVAQQLALCTYKDEELHPSVRFAKALTLLGGISLRDPNNCNAETLALGGAVYKRMWEQGGRLEDLYSSLNFYRAAYERNPEQDRGYGGVNAAFLLDVLASRLANVGARSAGTLDEANILLAEAQTLREQMKTRVPLAAVHDTGLYDAYWFLVTLAEIDYGLKDYGGAQSWLEKAAAVRKRKEEDWRLADEWTRQTTGQQLAKLARLHKVPAPDEGSASVQWHEAWRTLIPLVGEEAATALSVQRGKVGLALSGGGFRASFFHLGVLARLAEVDALRGVEVLSTVSGGSVLGAHYYLEVQRLLETKPDDDITREDYIEVIKRVQQNFFEGVQSNIRMRAFGDFKKNLRMMLGQNYTRSHRLGELYEEALYSKVNDGRAGAERTMQQLLIKPKREPQDFKPKFANWRRRAKVPVLLLSATTLNSGHNWHFTASWMGEPPGLLEEFNVNERYRRLYYQEAPVLLRDYRLGHAVAASACVPGLFEPLTIDGLYENHTIRLVDGGVHDNQGVAGLLDEGCTMILCSDASGQMADLAKPGEDPAGVVLRASSVLQARVREAEHQDLRARLDSHSLEGLLFLHTKKGLGINPLPWIGCQEEKYTPLDEDKPTAYGVNARLQRLIAGIRTDLDSFTEVEAYALMASGYLMTKNELEHLQTLHDQEGGVGGWGGYQTNAPTVTWPFANLIPLLRQKPEDSAPGKDLEEQLKAASSIILKAWKLIPDLKRMGVITVAGIVVLLLIITWLLWGVTVFSVTLGGLVLALVALAVALFAPALRWLFPHDQARSLVLKTAMALAGYAVARVHLKWINRRFLEHGRLSRLLNL